MVTCAVRLNAVM